MKPLSAACIAGAAVLFSAPAVAAGRSADCRLVVKGKTYIDGICRFEADRDGSFRLFTDAFFAYVTVTGATAQASWNADPANSHADAQLGVLTRKGACWENATAQNLRPRPVPGKTGRGDRGAAPWRDDLSGLAGRVADLRHPARRDMGGGSGARTFRAMSGVEGHGLPAQGRALTIDKQPGLCVGVARGPQRPTVQLQKCAEAGTKWTSKASSAESAPIVSGEGDCWSIPALADDAAKFPVPVEAAPCRDAKAKPLRFFFSAD